MSDIDNDPEIEFSPFTRSFVDHGITVTVNIFRIAEGDEGWSLEIIDSTNTSTVWDEKFATDEAAYEMFRSAVGDEGILTFVSLPERELQ